jgi:TatD DNase family protein
VLADTHCHLDFIHLSSQLPLLQKEMDSRQIGMLVVPSVEVSRWQAVIDICEKDNRFFFGLGLHPYFIGRHKLGDVTKLSEKISKLQNQTLVKLVAIGEIGLDFTCPSKEKQIELFEAQLALAECYRLPVILHTRKANTETLKILKRYDLVGGVVHAFSGSFELMMCYVELGLKIGVGPVITWPASSKTRSAIAKAPLDALVLETDAPDMAISGVERGLGSPVNVCDVYALLKEVRSESDQKLRQVLWENSTKLFNRLQIK